MLLVLLCIRYYQVQINSQAIWPDEEYQVLEPAYDDVFGGGYRTWEWNRDYPIRNPLIVMLVGLYFRLLKLTGLDFSFLVAYGCRYLFMLPLSIMMDYTILQIVRLLVPEHKKSTFLTMVVVIVSASNEFSVKLGVRVFYNTMEAALTSLGMLLWFRSGREFALSEHKDDLLAKRSFRNEVASRTILTINFMIRSSCVAIWPVSFLVRLVWQFVSWGSTHLYVLNSVHAHLSILVPFLLDVFYFRRITYTIWNFV